MSFLTADNINTKFDVGSTINVPFNFINIHFLKSLNPINQEKRMNTLATPIVTYILACYNPKRPISFPSLLP
jgi:hypothetical protein